MDYLIYAFYDRDGFIDFHVLDSLRRYIKYFKVIFVSNISLSKSEKKKISFVDHIIVDEHEEKDFGSWKIGINYLKRKKVHNLLLTNDSIVGPYLKIPEIVNKIKNSKIDFWGISSAGSDKNFHIQSYFLYFRESVIRNLKFKMFFKNIKKVSSKSMLVELYEIGLTQMLLAQGFKCETYLSGSRKDIHSDEKCIKFFLDGSLPVFKVKNFVSNPYRLKKVNKIFELLKEKSKYIKYIKRVNRFDNIDHLNFVLPQFKYYFISKKFLLFRAKVVSKNKFWRFYVKFCGIFIFFLIFPIKCNLDRLYISNKNY